MRIGDVRKVFKRDSEIAKICGVSRQRVGQWLVIPYHHREKVMEAIKEKQKAIDGAIKTIDRLLEEE